MTKFELLKAITDERQFSEQVFGIISVYNTPEAFSELLSEELAEKGLRTAERLARTGYPLSLERKQGGCADMTKFEAIKHIEGVKEFSNMIFALVKKTKTRGGFELELSKEIPEEGLQTLKSIAKRGNYPLSL